MPRSQRDIAPGIHHVGVSAAGPSQYYRDDVDHAAWTRLFVATIIRHHWTCIALCQLSTHWHALVDISDESLPAGMHYLNGEYSRMFNDRHSRVGYLVRGRYWSRRKTTGSELLTAFCYVVNNPVRAGIVSRAEDWPWSSYATTIGAADSFSFVDAGIVLAQFGSTFPRATATLREYVSAHS